MGTQYISFVRMQLYSRKDALDQSLNNHKKLLNHPREASVAKGPLSLVFLYSHNTFHNATLTQGSITDRWKHSLPHLFLHVLNTFYTFYIGTSSIFSYGACVKSTLIGACAHPGCSKWLLKFINRTSSAVLVRQSKPTYEKKSVPDPASNPFRPKGKYLKIKWNKFVS